MNKRTSKSKKYSISSNRRRIPRRLFTGFIFAFILCVSGSAFLVSAKGISNADSIHTYYRSIEIQKGDTLWDIAEETKPQDCQSTAEFVRMIKDINCLNSDDIQTGQYLIITYDI